MVLTLIVQVLVGFGVAVGAVWHALGGSLCARYRKDGLLLLAVAALVFAPTLIAQQARPADPLAAGFSELIAGLKATPGCLGIELARTASGKQVVFAWFEDKRALMNWYSSDIHLRAMHAVFPGHQAGGTTLKDLPDDAGPILSVASVTLVDPAESAPNARPFKQIAIEHYVPLAGGIAVGGRFAPSALKVPGMREIPLSSISESDK
jgi:quinol monooxygenase YgiN